MDPIKNFINENIKRNWITTVLGILFLLGSLAGNLFFDQTWTDLIIPLTIGFVLLPMKDPKKKGPGGSALLVVISIFLSSCVTYQKCQDKYGSEVVDTIEVKKEIFVSKQYKSPKETYSFNLRLDSLLWAKPGQSTTFSNNKNSVRANISKDAANDQVQLEIVCDPDTVTISDTIKFETKVPCPDRSFEDTPSFWDKAWKHTQDIATIGFVACLIILIFKK